MLLILHAIGTFQTGKMTLRISYEYSTVLDRSQKPRLCGPEHGLRAPVLAPAHAHVVASARVGQPCRRRNLRGVCGRV